MFTQTPNEEMDLNQLSGIIDNIFEIISSGTFQTVLGLIILVIVASIFKKELDLKPLLRNISENNISNNNKTILSLDKERIEIIYALHFESTRLALIESLERFIRSKIQKQEGKNEDERIKDDVISEIRKVIEMQRNRLLAFRISNSSNNLISMKEFLEDAVNIQDKNLIPEKEMDNFIKELRKLLNSKDYNFEWRESFNDLVREFETKSKRNLEQKLRDLF